MRFFNTTGPIRPEDHYSIAPLDRLDLDEVLSLVRNKRYFVLHAPRQTGKTSVLLALRDLLNGGAEGRYRCVYMNVEAAQAAREQLDLAMRAILRELAMRARPDAARRLRGRDLEGRAHPGRAGRSARRCAHPLGGSGPGSAGAARRRDRLVGRRHAALGAEAASRRLRPPPGELPPECGPVRGTRRARLPHPLQRGEDGHHRRQRLQRQGPLAAAGRFLARRGAGPARPAHRGDRAGVFSRRRRSGSGPSRRASPGW